MKKQAIARARVALIAAALAMSGCVHASGVSSGQTAVREIAPGILEGYVAHDQAPDSRRLIPGPPQPGQAMLARDEAASLEALALRGSARWTLATRDAELKFPAAADAFACALGVRPDARSTPRLMMLLQRSLTDLGFATYAAKTRYQRPRPFMVNGEPQCTPADEDKLRKDGSYPSGHSAIGFGWGLILAEIAPERATELAVRGRAFGDSRRICNVHWLSDVEEGRIVAAATLARMHAEPAFLADLAEARREVAAARAAGALKPEGCEAEAEALKIP